MTDATPPRYEAQFQPKAPFTNNHDRVSIKNNFRNPDGTIFTTSTISLSVEEATDLVASLRTALAIGRLINTDDYTAADGFQA